MSRIMGSVKVGARRVVGRLRVVEEAGQDVLEYAGMLIVVAFVVVGLFSLNLPNTVAGGVANAYNSVFQGQTTVAKAPQVTVPSNIGTPASPSGNGGTGGHGKTK